MPCMLFTPFQKEMSFLKLKRKSVTIGGGAGKRRMDLSMSNSVCSTLTQPVMASRMGSPSTKMR